MRKLFCFLTCVLTIFILGCPQQEENSSSGPSAVQAESRPVKKRLCSVVVIGNTGEDELTLREISGLAPGVLLVQDEDSDADETVFLGALDPEESKKVDRLLEKEKKWAEESGLRERPDPNMYDPDEFKKYEENLRKNSGLRVQPEKNDLKTPTSSRSMSGMMLAQTAAPAPAKTGLLTTLSDDDLDDDDVSAEILAGVISRNFSAGTAGDTREDASGTAESFSQNMLFPSFEDNADSDPPIPIIPDEDEDDEMEVYGEKPLAAKPAVKPETVSPKKPLMKEFAAEKGKSSSADSSRAQRAKPMTEEEIRELTEKHLEAFLALNKNLSDDLLREIAAANFQNYSVWFGESFQGEFYAVRYFEYVGDNFDHDYFQLMRSPVYRKWLDEQKKYIRPMSSMYATSDVWLDMTELFHSGTRFPAGSVKFSFGGEETAKAE